MILQPTKTLAGRTATFNAFNSGLNLPLTHISIGDVGGPVVDNLIALRHELERVPVFGSRVTTDQIHLDSVFDGPLAFWVREIGIWSGTTLVYYWSTTGVELGYKSQQTEWLMGFDLQLNEAVDSVIQITAQAPSISISIAPYLSTVLQSLCDTNRMVLKALYFK
jgi:hypothetical protein